MAEIVSWMDHGTLALLWGMMVIVGVSSDPLWVPIYSV
jgi:hypothetical protein